jgi:hypothetical protein
LVDGSVGMLLWGSIATCVREGFGTSSEGGAFTTISELVGGVSIMGRNYYRWGQWLNQKQPF